MRILSVAYAYKSHYASRSEVCFGRFGKSALAVQRSWTGDPDDYAAERSRQGLAGRVARRRSADVGAGRWAGAGLAPRDVGGRSGCFRTSHRDAPTSVPKKTAPSPRFSHTMADIVRLLTLVGWALESTLPADDLLSRSVASEDAMNQPRQAMTS